MGGGNRVEYLMQPHILHGALIDYSRYFSYKNARGSDGGGKRRGEGGRLPVARAEKSDRNSRADRSRARWKWTKSVSLRWQRFSPALRAEINLSFIHGIHGAISNLTASVANTESSFKNRPRNSVFSVRHHVCGGIWCDQSSPPPFPSRGRGHYMTGVC